MSSRPPGYNTSNEYAEMTGKRIAEDIIHWCGKNLSKDDLKKVIDRDVANYMIKSNGQTRFALGVAEIEVALAAANKVLNDDFPPEKTFVEVPC